MDEKKYTRYFFILICLSFIARLLIASLYGLTGDEAHYYQYAVHPSLSYFDHPPLVGYSILPFLKIFGNTSLAVRMPALICSSLCMWLLFLMGRNFYSAACGFWASVIFCLIPLFSVLGGIIIVPDTLVSVFWLLSLMIVWKIRLSGRQGLWYLLGLIAGLSLLAKYSGVLLYPAILLFIIIDKEMRGYLKKKQIYLGFLISLLVFSPVFIWNYNNHWASFIFQFKHGLGKNVLFDPSVFLQNIIGQMAVISPFIWIMMVIVFFNMVKKLFVSSDILNKLFFSFSFPVLAVFGYASLANEVLPHWPSAGYLTLVLPCAFFLLECPGCPVRRRKILVKTVIFTGLIFTLIIPVQIVFRIFSLPEEIDPTNDIYGWDQASKFAMFLCSESGKETFLLTHKFYLASQMAFYLPETFAKNRLYCLSRRIDQYDFWQANKDLRSYLNGKDAIFFTDEHFRDTPEKMYRFAKVEKPVRLEIFYRNKKVKTFYFYKCEDFKTAETDSVYFDSLALHQRNFFKDLISADNKIFLIFNNISRENRWFAKILYGIGFLGSTETAVLIVSIILYLSRKKEFLKYLGIFMTSLLISALVVHVLKEIFPQPRPVIYFGKDYHIFITGPVLKAGSFPSGHAQTAFVSAAFLGWVFPDFCSFFMLVAGLISFSRVFCGVHFFRDIFAGAFIGLIVFWVVLRTRLIINFLKQKINN